MLDDRTRLIDALCAYLAGVALDDADAEAIADMLRADGESFTVLERMLSAVSDDLAQQAEENDRLKERLAEKAAPLPQTRNSEALRSFVQTCIDHPEWRFWQALRNWSGWSFVLLSTMPPHDLPVELRDKFIDTFYWEEQQGRKEGPSK